MVANLTAGMIERLQLYQAKNKRLPERILIYRDGVSEVDLSSTLFAFDVSALDVGTIRPCAERGAASNPRSVQEDLSQDTVQAEVDHHSLWKASSCTILCDQDR